LRAYQSDMMDRFVSVATDVLADGAGLSPDDPELQIAERDSTPMAWLLLLHPLAYETLEALEFFVNLIDEELDDHGVVVCWSSRIVEKLGCLRVPKGDRARRHAFAR
jgi:hypothetical protein